MQVIYWNVLYFICAAVVKLLNETNNYLIFMQNFSQTNDFGNLEHE